MQLFHQSESRPKESSDAACIEEAYGVDGQPQAAIVGLFITEAANPRHSARAGLLLVSAVSTCH